MKNKSKKVLIGNIKLLFKVQSLEAAIHDLNPSKLTQVVCYLEKIKILIEQVPNGNEIDKKIEELKPVLNLITKLKTLHNHKLGFFKHHGIDLGSEASKLLELATEKINQEPCYTDRVGGLFFEDSEELYDDDSKINNYKNYD